MRLRVLFGWLCALALISGAGVTSADVAVWLDFANFSSRLDELAVSAGIDPFSSAEQTSIRSSIQSRMAAVYWNFTISFTETAPDGEYETVRFGSTTNNSNLLGQAEQIDFLNLNKHNVADIFTANFAFILDEFSGSVNRDQQLDQLTAALAGTAAHELAHHLGLQHFDAYGDDRIGPENYGNTQGYQNEHIMATGSTGLTEQAGSRTGPWRRWSWPSWSTPTGSPTIPLPPIWSPAAFTTPRPPPRLCPSPTCRSRACMDLT